MSSYANPTALRIGMSGMLDGRNYTVLGRVVFGVTIDETIYYWQEFYLGDRGGEVATLVFEETEDGPTWKFFRAFKPATPFSVRDAGAKRRGEGVSLTSRPARITLVGVSRVYYVEGTAPEGVAVGDVDNYFNAETDRRMVVVSWKGETIEFYEGRNLPHGVTEAVFGLPPPRCDWIKSFFSSYAGWDWETIKPVIIGIMFLGFVIFSQIDLNYDPGVFHPEPPPKLEAPDLRLPIGAHGMLTGRNYTIIGYTLAEVAQVGKRFDRHEYLLADDQGGQALLIQGLRGGPEWHLFKPATAVSSQAPCESAAVRPGANVILGDRKLPVTRLFMETARRFEGSEAVALWPAKTLYGYVAGTGNDWLVLRWSETSLWVCTEGRAMEQKDVLAALGKAH